MANNLQCTCSKLFGGDAEMKICLHKFVKSPQIMSELDRLVVEIDLDKQGSISEPSNAPASESWVLN